MHIIQNRNLKISLFAMKSNNLYKNKEKAMKKTKTQQEIQEQIDRIIERIDERMKPLNDEVYRLIKRKDRMKKLMFNLEDPHAIIPPGYNSVTEWIASEGCITYYIARHIFPNRVRLQYFIPRDGSYKGWKIVRCNPPTYYSEAIKFLNK